MVQSTPQKDVWTLTKLFLEEDKFKNYIKEDKKLEEEGQEYGGLMWICHCAIHYPYIIKIDLVLSRV